MNSKQAPLAESLAINAPLVVSETIDGEAIIMHHGSGRYFDISGSGALIWQGIEQQASVAQIAAHFAASYGLSAENAAKFVNDFIAELSAHDLVRAQPSAVGAALPAPFTVAATFMPPVLGAHDDLADMLLLDPIHDVDEGGWPAARPAAPAA